MSLLRKITFLEFKKLYRNTRFWTIIPEDLKFDIKTIFFLELTDLLKRKEYILQNKDGYIYEVFLYDDNQIIYIDDHFYITDKFKLGKKIPLRSIKCKKIEILTIDKYEYICISYTNMWHIYTYDNISKSYIKVDDDLCIINKLIHYDKYIINKDRAFNLFSEILNMNVKKRNVYVKTLRI